ncbi:MAG: hypothetical protein WCR42_07365 [bacterium]
MSLKIFQKILVIIDSIYSTIETALSIYKTSILQGGLGGGWVINILDKPNLNKFEKNFFIFKKYFFYLKKEFYI